MFVGAMIATENIFRLFVIYAEHQSRTLTLYDSHKKHRYNDSVVDYTTFRLNIHKCAQA